MRKKDKDFVGPPLCPYGITYRRDKGVLASWSFKNPSQVVPEESEMRMKDENACQRQAPLQGRRPSAAMWRLLLSLGQSSSPTVLRM